MPKRRNETRGHLPLLFSGIRSCEYPCTAHLQNEEETFEMQRTEQKKLVLKEENDPTNDNALFFEEPCEERVE